MRFRADRATLADAVADCAKATTTRLPVLAGARVDVADGAATICCTDLDLTIAATVPVDDAEDGTAIVPASLLAAFLKAGAGDTAAVSAADGRAVVEVGESTVELALLDADDWPRLDTDDGTPVELSLAQLAGLQRVATCASRDATQPLATGVHLDGKTAGATDRYRLARLDFELPLAEPVTIPAAVLNAVARGCDGHAPTLQVGTRWQATFATPQRKWTTRTIEGAYPDLGRLVRESSPHHLEMPRQRLLEAVKRVGLLADDVSRTAVLTVEGDKTTIRNRSTQRGRIVDVVPSTGDLGEPLGMSAPLLADLLANVDDETVTFEIETAMKVVVVRSGALTQAIMPVRVDVAP